MTVTKLFCLGIDSSLPAPDTRRRIHESVTTSKVGGSVTGVVEEDVHQNAADQDVEPDGQRHTRQPLVTVEAAAPGAVDGRQRQRHHERRQHDVRDEKPEVDGAQPRRTVEGDRAHLGVVGFGVLWRVGGRGRRCGSR